MLCPSPTVNAKTLWMNELYYAHFPDTKNESAKFRGKMTELKTAGSSVVHAIRFQHIVNQHVMIAIPYISAIRVCPRKLVNKMNEHPFPRIHFGLCADGKRQSAKSVVKFLHSE